MVDIVTQLFAKAFAALPKQKRPYMDELVHFPASVRKNAGKLLRECLSESRLKHYRATVSPEYLDSIWCAYHHEYGARQAFLAFCGEHAISAERATPLFKEVYGEYLASFRPS